MLSGVSYGVRRISGEYVEACDECGFDSGSFDDVAISDRMRSVASDWATILGGSEKRLRMRPAPATWCAFEYAHHVAEAWNWLGRLLDGTAPPSPAPPMTDPTAVGDACDAWSAATLARDIASAMEPFIEMASHVAGTTAIRAPVSLGVFSLDLGAMLRHGLHDTAHHVLDVRRGLAALRLREGVEVVFVQR